MTAIEFLRNHNAENNWGVEERDLFETLNESKRVHEQRRAVHRWWNSVYRVCEIEGNLIGFTWAESTGDSDLSDLGWEPHLEDIHFCEKHEEVVTLTKFRKI